VADHHFTVAGAVPEIAVYGVGVELIQGRRGGIDLPDRAEVSTVGGPALVPPRWRRGRLFQSRFDGNKGVVS
jgi:hypothetical protein